MSSQETFAQQCDELSFLFIIDKAWHVVAGVLFGVVWNPAGSTTHAIFKRYKILLNILHSLQLPPQSLKHINTWNQSWF